MDNPQLQMFFISVKVAVIMQQIMPVFDAEGSD
jgi:hypothetical protein